MDDSDDLPPRQAKQRARKAPVVVADPSNSNKTIELETADLLQLGQSGDIEAFKHLTRQISPAEKVLVDLGPDPNAAPKEQTVFVDIEPEPAKPPVTTPPPASSATALNGARPSAAALTPLPAVTPKNVQRVTPTVPRVTKPRAASDPHRAKQGGTWLIVVLYIVCAAALAGSIYTRWFAA